MKFAFRFLFALAIIAGAVFCEEIKESKMPINHQLVPKLADRVFWKAIDQEKAKIIVEYADKILAEPVNSISFYDFLRGGLEGDRATHEAQFFARRHKLVYLAVAAGATGNVEKYRAKIIDYLWELISEPFWTVYAHAQFYNEENNKDPMVQDISSEKADLFASATAACIGVTLNIMGDELEKISPRFVEKVRQVTIHKTVDSVRNPQHDYLHWWKDNKYEFTNNWTPWCSLNLLTASLCLEKDDSQVRALIKELQPKIMMYFDSFAEDGFCDEGAGYWTAGVACFYMYLHLLEAAEPELARSIIDSAKFRNMGEYFSDARVTDTLYATYADGHALVSCTPLLLVLYGQDVKSSRLETMGYRALEQDKGKLDNYDFTAYPYLQVMNLFLKPAVPKGDCALSQNTLFPKRICIVRNPQGFSATMKGGHNNESHNHNDLGHFTVYFKGKQVVLDAGTERYAMKNFSDQRYEIWYCGAEGHNAPFINGIGQVFGREYIGELSGAHKDGDAYTYSVNLSKAYPAAARVKNFVRTMTIAPQEVTVSDVIQADKLENISFKLYSPMPITIVDNGLRFGDAVRLELENLNAGDVSSFEVDKTMASGNGSPFYVVTISGKAPKYSLKFLPL